MTCGDNELYSKQTSKGRYKTGAEQTLTTKILEVGSGAM